MKIGKKGLCSQTDYGPMDHGPNSTNLAYNVQGPWVRGPFGNITEKKNQHGHVHAQKLTTNMKPNNSIFSSNNESDSKEKK